MNRSLVLSSIAAVSLILLGVPAREAHAVGGNYWFVSSSAPGASDANSCTAVLQPCKTIQGAVNKASWGDSIFVAAGTYQERVTITTTLSLYGQGTDAINTFTTSHKGTLVGGQTGDANGGVFFINPPSGDNIEVEIDGMDIGGASIDVMGATNQGGGIYNGAGSLLTLNRDRIFDNTIHAPSYVSGSDAQGGGIYNAAGASLTILDTEITGNTVNGGADFTAGKAGEGGGIYNAGALTVYTGTIDNNVANGGAGLASVLSGVPGETGGLGAGGGLYMDPAANRSDITDLTVYKNSANGGTGGAGATPGGGAGGDGGAGGAATGGGIADAASTDYYVSDTLSSNAATGGVGGAAGLGSPNGTPGVQGSASGGGMSAAASPTVSGTAMAYNTVNGAAASGPDCSGSFTSGGDNIIENASGCSGFSPPDVVNSPSVPFIANEFGGNSGIIPVVFPFAGSNYNTVELSTCQTVGLDAIGIPRPAQANGNCTSGAAEYTGRIDVGPAPNAETQPQPLSPQTIVAGSGNVTVTINGTGFSRCDPNQNAGLTPCQVLIDGTPRTATFVSPTQITFLLPSAFSTTAGVTHQVWLQVPDASGALTTDLLPAQIHIVGQSTTVTDSDSVYTGYQPWLTPAWIGGYGPDTPGSVSATAYGGNGSIAVASYSRSPVAPSPSGLTSFFDVSAAPDSANGFTTVYIVDCAASNISNLYWFNRLSSQWTPVAAAQINTSYVSGCDFITVDSKATSPTLAQLKGTIFASDGGPTRAAIAAAGVTRQGSKVSARWTVASNAGITGFFITQGSRRLATIAVHRSRTYRAIVAALPHRPLALHTVLWNGGAQTTLLK